MAKVPKQLQQAADQVHENGKTKSVRVRDLLSWFDAQRRGILVVREIRAALKKVRLITDPDFEVAYIDQRIKLKCLATTDKKPPTSKVDVAKESAAAAGPAELAPHGGGVPDPAPRIGMLKAANTPPLSVTRDAEVSQAVR